MSRLKSDSELETARFRQAVYIEFCKSNNILNPCSNQVGYERIIACFIEQLMLDHNSHSATVCWYVKAINTLFCLCHFDIPADLSDHSNMCYKFILTQEREENIAQQRSPISREVFTTLLDQKRSRLPIHSKLLWQIGLPSFGSRVCAAPSMHRKPNQLLTKTNTHRENVSLKHSFQAAGSFITAKIVS